MSSLPPTLHRTQVLGVALGLAFGIGKTALQVAQGAELRGLSMLAEHDAGKLLTIVLAIAVVGVLGGGFFGGMCLSGLLGALVDGPAMWGFALAGVGLVLGMRRGFSDLDWVRNATT